MDVSLVIPAHNEEKCLVAALEKRADAPTQRSGYGEALESLVVANSCNAISAAVAADFATTCPRGRVTDIASPIRTVDAVLAGFQEARAEVFW